ncbi:hypothetical protein pb186bvf_019880 [Paramecium bursaria]
MYEFYSSLKLSKNLQYFEQIGIRLINNSQRKALAQTQFYIERLLANQYDNDEEFNLVYQTISNPQQNHKVQHHL